MGLLRDRGIELNCEEVGVKQGWGWRLFQDIWHLPSAREGKRCGMQHVRVPTLKLSPSSLFWVSNKKENSRIFSTWFMHNKCWLSEPAHKSGLDTAASAAGVGTGTLPTQQSTGVGQRHLSGDGLHTRGPLGFGTTEDGLVGSLSRSAVRDHRPI